MGRGKAGLVAAGLVAATVTGVAQARRMTWLRQDVPRTPDSLELTARVRRGAQNAVLRAATAARSLVLPALGTVIAL